MRVSATPEATSFIVQRGGRLFVWATDHRCCRGGRFTVLDADTVPPAKPRPSFARVEAVGFTVFLWPGPRSIPEELVVEMRGRRRRRVEAFWNGCVYVV